MCATRYFQGCTSAATFASYSTSSTGLMASSASRRARTCCDETTTCRSRDRFRSSWEDFPHTASLIVSQVRPGESTPRPLDYQWVVETVAVRWHAANLPLFDRYWERSGIFSPEIEAYPIERGRGDGRRLEGVTPLSMRVDWPIDSPCVEAPDVDATILPLHLLTLLDTGTEGDGGVMVSRWATLLLHARRVGTLP